MKILQLSYKIPFPQHDGGAYSVYQSSINMLEAGFDVKMLAMQTPKDVVDTSGAFDAFKVKTRFEFVPADTRVKPVNALLNLFKSDSYFVERFYSEVFAEKIRHILLQESFDVVVLEHLYLCQYIEDIRRYSKAKIVLRAQNVEHELWENYTGKVKNPLVKKFLNIATQRLKFFEQKMARQLDGVIALTSHDALFFKMAGEKKLQVSEIPVGFLHTPVTSVKKHDLPVLFHLGSMDWLPNRQGIDWFLEKVFPLVLQQYPQVKLNLAGKKMPAKYWRLKHPNVLVEGEVASSVQYMADKDILVVPLLSGGGMRVKIIEAMACGKTVISTPLGASGIVCKHNRDILMGDSAWDLAQQIVRCLQSRELVNAIGKNALETVQEHYGPIGLAQKTRLFYEKLLGIQEKAGQMVA